MKIFNFIYDLFFFFISCFSKRINFAREKSDAIAKIDGTYVARDKKKKPVIDPLRKTAKNKKLKTETNAPKPTITQQKPPAKIVNKKIEILKRHFFNLLK